MALRARWHLYAITYVLYLSITLEIGPQIWVGLFEACYLLLLPDLLLLGLKQEQYGDLGLLKKSKTHKTYLV